MPWFWAKTVHSRTSRHDIQLDGCLMIKSEGNMQSSEKNHCSNILIYKHSKFLVNFLKQVNAAHHPFLFVLSHFLGLHPLKTFELGADLVLIPSKFAFNFLEECFLLVIASFECLRVTSLRRDLVSFDLDNFHDEDKYITTPNLWRRSTITVS
eukprot:m.1518624 g.1518624  ORF g.1518624 m.1518624 type:complete len:153 (+) comp25221_c3_seq11:4775-5233(+)